ncbi:DUF4913 domain-containing protein [Streptomyces mayonensis]|uniref:DUF4913 domain-containing protein n=1 Tax=Streptomyces mayonensis TaxID=2750816 RepID=UPI001C1DD5EF|nr:DUF4913 domain-containing protein [Streptomyces sp. A108]MBU6534221.1 DUF4913 domain-containing protein [Streptomyces sp. A108]
MTTAPAEKTETPDTGPDTETPDTDAPDTRPDTGAGPPGTATPDKEPPPPAFILYMQGPAYAHELRQLTLWTHHVLLPVYGREASSGLPWCPVWWEHPEAVAQLHGLWLAWGDLTGPGSPPTGPAMWHRDYLFPAMSALRDPQGPFAGCKPGMHRPKTPPPIDTLDPFGPPPPPPPPA